MSVIHANSVDLDQMLWHLIWVCTVCQCPIYGMLGTNGLRKVYSNYQNLLNCGYTKITVYYVCILNTKIFFKVSLTLFCHIKKHVNDYLVV